MAGLEEALTLLEALKPNSMHEPRFRVFTELADALRAGEAWEHEARKLLSLSGCAPPKGGGPTELMEALARCFQSLVEREVEEAGWGPCPLNAQALSENGVEGDYECAVTGGALVIKHSVGGSIIQALRYADSEFEITAPLSVLGGGTSKLAGFLRAVEEAGGTCTWSVSRGRFLVPGERSEGVRELDASILKVRCSHGGALSPEAAIAGFYLTAKGREAGLKQALRKLEKARGRGWRRPATGASSEAVLREDIAEIKEMLRGLTRKVDELLALYRKTMRRPTLEEFRMELDRALSEVASPTGWAMLADVRQLVTARLGISRDDFYSYLENLLTAVPHDYELSPGGMEGVTRRGTIYGLIRKR